MPARKPRRPKTPFQFTFSDPIYGFHYIAQVGGDINDLITHFSKCLGVEPELLGTNCHRLGHFRAVEPQKNGAIWLAETAGPEIVAHECVHAAAYVFELLNVPLRGETEEVYAYYVQWLVAEVFKGMQVGKMR